MTAIRMYDSHLQQNVIQFLNYYAQQTNYFNTQRQSNVFALYRLLGRKE